MKFLFCPLCGHRPGQGIKDSSQEDSPSDSDSESDRERKKDLRERDEFASRLREKDKDKTRNVMSKSDKKVNCLFVWGFFFHCFL